MMDPAEPNKLGRRIVTGVVLGVLCYGAIAIATDVERLAGQLATFPVGVLLGALALSVVNYAVRWAKWHYYLRVVGCAVDGPTSATVFVAGLTMSITPGKVGEVLKSVLLQRSHGLPVAQTAPIVIAERITDLLGLFMIAGMGIGMFDFGRWAFALIVGAVFGGIGVLSSPRAVIALLGLVERLPLGDRLRPRLEEAYGSMRRLLELRPLTFATVLSVASWSMEALAFFWILGALGADVSPLLASFVYAMTTILGAVSFLPGGLGVTEGSMIGALLIFGVFTDEVTATTATYLIRLATLWFAVVLGVFGLLAFERRR